ncbi:MAG: hypothetical protein Q8P24_12440 [Desulfobacterales bacterium]|nr:hypothetical protein [Desulfobacterales bacterium]
MIRKHITVAVACAILLGILLPAIYVLAGPKDTPQKAAVEFSKAYLGLNRSMQERLCRALLQAENSEIVDNYLHRVTQEAKNRGFDSNLMSYLFYGIDTEIIDQNNTAAQVRITGKRRVAINLQYVLIGMIFNIGEVYPVDETIKVVNEDGKWKVCGSPFSLVEGI